MRTPSKPGLGEEPSWQTSNPAIHNGKEGRSRRETEPATGEGKPLKAKTQGRYRHETRPERLQAEQNVKRLRKPEGAAQPEEVIPVLVAACFCKRRRVQHPMKGGQGPFQ
jgi:organic hydroperoxide reductase OsmC/OhrA